MAWIIGLADKKEISDIEAAGYEVLKGIDGIDLGMLNVPNEYKINDLQLIAVPVDCDVRDLLIMNDEGRED
jgi:hypothetical protein